METDHQQMGMEAANYSTASENIAEPVNLELEPCPICTRTFVPATLAKHVKICEKMAMKKRKIFDSSRQRREGTDLASFLPKHYGLPVTKQEPKTSPKAVQNTPLVSPKRQEEVTKQPPFVQKKIIATTTSPPLHTPLGTQSAPHKEREKPKLASKRSLGPPSEQCPYCERCFGIKAYDRHVEWCKEKSRIANIQNNTTLTAAKERLQARTKYRAPCLKTKRQVNREKYSGFTSEDLANSLFDAGDICGTKADDQKMSMSTSLNSSIMSEGLKPSAILMELLKMKSEEVSLCSSPRPKSTKKSIGSLKKQRLSKANPELGDSSPGKSSSAKGAKLPKNRKLFRDFASLSEDTSANVLTDEFKNSIDTEQLLNSINVKEPNLGIVGEHCTLPEEEEDLFFDANDTQISNRTRRLYPSDSETENPEKKLIATDDLMSSNCSTRGVPIDKVSPSSTYINYDEIPVGGSKALEDFLNRNIESLQENQKSISGTENTQQMQFSSEKEENEFSDFLSSADTAELSSHIIDIKENITQKYENIKSPHTEELISNLTELYNNSSYNKKNAPRTELKRVKSAMRKLTRGKTEFSNSSENDTAISWDFPEGIEDVTKEKENESLSSPAKSFTVKTNREKNNKHQNSSGFSDKYDPFLSAKRQLEELCSPSSPTKPLLSPTTPQPKQRTTSLSSSLSSSSNPRNTLNTVKSNFRRTSSLRAPRKPSARPLFITPTLQRPTIQRGLSDEGPISTKFLKPEEYDEMPVKSVCMNDFAVIHHHSPKVVKRDANSNLNRRNLRLNLNKSSDKTNNSNPLAKTDSLAVFLKYENEAKQQAASPSSDLTEKDLKDKTNILNKQTYQKNPTTVTTPLSDKENISSVQDKMPNIIESNNSFGDISKCGDRVDQPSKSLVPNKIYPIRLEPISKPISPPKRSSSNEDTGCINLSSILNFKDDDFIDPKLINVCDNLPMNVSKLSDSDLTSSSTESACTAKIVVEPETQIQRQQQFQQFHQNSNSNRNSTEKRNLLKRQLRLGKNHFLYDMSPDSDPYSEECDKTISMIESNTKLFDTSLDEPSFEDFNFEEFLSSFEHDEDQFPIFKDCKEFLLNRSFNKRCNNLGDPSVRSPIALNLDGFENEEQKREIFISIETDNSPSPTDPRPILPDIEEIDKNANKLQKTDSDRNSSHDEKQDVFQDIPDVNRNNARNIMKKMEHDFNQNETTVTHDCEPVNSIYPADSDEISSTEYFVVPRNTTSKQSADSAYGSLSRHSPTDHRSLRRNPSRTRQQSASSIPEQQLPSKPKYLQKTDSKQQRNRDLSSASSSGSDTSLPPIRPQMMEFLGKDLSHQRTTEPRMSKFCHECGSKFLITHAKFCMECGVRRVVLE